jgi:phosphoglycerate dehydrogenase-like enzyme
MRKLPNVLFSPHRAAAVEGGRHLIGDLLLNDLDLILDGKPPRHLTRAAAFDTAAVAGVGDATSVVEMASQRA